MMKSVFFLSLLLSNCIIQAQELSLYSIDSFHKGNEEYGLFVSLTHDYPFSEDPDSAIIAEEYLGYDASRNYHILSESKRALFLKTLEISESDSLFLFLFGLDTVVQFPVNELSVIAHLSPYSYEGPLSEYEFMVGFELENWQIPGAENYYVGNLVFVGDENPFVTGQIEAMLLKRIGTHWEDTERVNSGVGNKYVYSNDSTSYYIENILSGDLSGRHVVVIEDKSKEILFDRKYIESEDGSLNPLSISGEPNSDGIYQWTGAILKGKPSMIYGFLSYSFSCPTLDFFGEAEQVIGVKCDNRH